MGDYSLSVFGASDPGDTDGCLSPADPAAGTDGPIRYRPAYFASQIDAATALHDRLYGDGVTHEREGNTGPTLDDADATLSPAGV